jgi:uncharacterized protein YegP (UPF0339 family)
VIYVASCKTAAVVSRRESLMATEFEIYKDDADDFRWRLQDDNNRIIADSAEGYERKSTVEDAITNVKDAAARATINDRT